ncbi:hypothetical protein K470DRAFT_259891 [Piedraia hortae CBS 480.64]|uniref:BTB domain-containing protein n=1 Tax=Piedraia hortae CBS 480.64 TaxID=1314780 RepID=A0A6A7BUI3_9PEZI|nr:hypothetical protein K470DRAFT_259891 [Piedraia hortae CBS 480.64]
MEELKAGLVELYKTRDLADLTINCGSYNFYEHKAILGAQSDYFKTLTNFKEGKTNIINLKAQSDGDEGNDIQNDDPAAIKHMIDFFYHLDYTAAYISPAPFPSSRATKSKGKKCGYARVGHHTKTSSSFQQLEPTYCRYHSKCYGCDDNLEGSPSGFPTQQSDNNM